MRKLCPAQLPCSAGCKYCFSTWSNYQKSAFNEDIELGSKSILIYPCCDGDYFMQSGMNETIKRYSEKFKYIYVSISSKIEPSKESLKSLFSLNEWLLSTGRGMVKYASSISTVSMINEIEPNTMSYEKRYEIASKFKENGITVSLTLKPVMPFISGEEYCSIVEKYSELTKYVVIGGLYVNKDTDFYRSYIMSQYDTIKRRVSWLPNKPLWDYLEPREQMEQIKEYCFSRSISLFESDNLLFEYLVKGGIGK